MKTVPNGTRNKIQFMSLTAHLVFEEIPFGNIEATAVLLCCILVTLDLQYN